MIPNITRGGSMAGLMTYLVGPGRGNVHTEPHLVTGDSAIMAWHDDAELSHLAALDIAAQLDQPRKVFGTEVLAPNYLRDDEGNELRGPNGKRIKHPDRPLKDGNVWHCSLSLSAAEGQLTDDQWARVAHDFMDRMGFTEASGRSPARWVAVRHGLSKKGNDHIHIAASAVREDGTKVSTWNDHPRAQKIVAELEREHGLVVIESRGKAPSIPGYHPGEVASAKRRGDLDPARDYLRPIVRACATASKTEAEFVRRLRREGLAVSARFAAGRSDVVVGYKVGLKPRMVGGKWERVVYYGGGELAPELALPALRESCGWERTPETASEAVDEWTAAKRGRPIVHDGGRETRELTDPALIERAAKDLGQWNKYLRSIPHGDHAQWANAAGRTAGVLAAWSRRVDPKLGRELAAAARAIERSAQVYPSQRFHKPVGRIDFATSAALLLMQTTNVSAATGWVLVLRQLLKTMEAIHDAQVAMGQLQRAEHIDYARRVNLAAVRTQLPQKASAGSVAVATEVPMDPELAKVRQFYDAQRGRGAEAAGTREPGSPIPAKLDPDVEQPTVGVQPEREGGVER
ncbi:relaxase/mobilization nuclease domain-containing protein [Nocardia sp. NPDC058176]|uniref:relaxase/mobilization nuclease domain-containing protein n=1 Tax=Nocardia sp. NPDC058176 TaxID=3346368 RepID=UPI0036DD7674